ncbi:MAG: dienelactone hydrolase family protein [SAR324 cluster bacterium]|nr:dienelactone hydrolase family protein [SAR324 cluster bacterium]
MSINTETIRITGKNGTFDGYLALPEGGGPRPGVIVIQEVFGVNSHIKDVTGRVAELGYVALAPDMFWPVEPGFDVGYEGADMEQAIAHMQKMNVDTAVEDVAAAIEALDARAESEAGKTGVVGFCWGGLITYLVACRLNPTCAVSYYGGRIVQFIDEAAKMANPVTFHVGEQDSSIPMEQVEQIKQAVAGKSGVEVHTYPDAEHGFHCDQRASYHEASAKQAWQRTGEFFGKHLG